MDISRIQPNIVDAFRNLQPQQNRQPAVQAIPAASVKSADSTESPKDDSAKSDIERQDATVQGGVDVQA